MTRSISSLLLVLFLSSSLPIPLASAQPEESVVDPLARLADPYASPAEGRSLGERTPREDLIPLVKQALEHDPRFSSGSGRRLLFDSLTRSNPRNSEQSSLIPHGELLDILIDGALEEPAEIQAVCLRGLQRCEPVLRAEVLVRLADLADSDNEAVLASVLDLTTRYEQLSPRFAKRFERLAFEPHAEPEPILIAMAREGGIASLGDRFGAFLRHLAMSARWSAGFLREDLDRLDTLDPEGKRAAAYTLLAGWAGERFITSEPEDVLLRAMTYLETWYAADRSIMPDEPWLYVSPLVPLLSKSPSLAVREAAAETFMRIAAIREDPALADMIQQTIESAPRPIP